MTERTPLDGTVPPLLRKLTLAGALSYFSALTGAVFPALFGALPGVATPQGAELVHLRALLLAVVPLGGLYLYALAAGRLELIRLTIFWRFLLVGPWIVLSAASGNLQPAIAALLLGVDVGIPLLAVLLTHQGLTWLRLPWRKRDSLVDNFLMLESVHGFGFINAFALALTFQPEAVLTSPETSYVLGFAVAVFGCLYLLLAWVATSDDPDRRKVGLVARTVMFGVALFWIALGMPAPVGQALAAATGIGLLIHCYSTLFEDKVQGKGSWSEGKWLVLAAVVLAVLSSLWFSASPKYNDTCVELSKNIHRQDMIIAALAIVVGIAAANIKQQAPLHARALAWLLPIAAVWFTTETKILCHLEAGSPFHPSWTERGLAPVWADSPVVNVTFWAATMLLTALATGYLGMVVFRFYRPEGWTQLVKHGGLLVLASGIWMASSSSGTAAPVPSLPSLPPFFPVDAIQAVSIHVYDLLLGIGMMALGPALHAALKPADRRLPQVVVAVAWWAFVLPKLWLHLGSPPLAP